MNERIERRHSPALVSLQHAVPGALARLLRGTPLSDGKLTFAWRSVVGPSIDHATTVKLEAPDTLLVEVKDERWRQEVSRAQSVIVGRLAQLLGPGVVRRLAVRVESSRQRPLKW